MLNDPGEASLLEILASGGFQAAQTLSDSASIQNPSPGAASSENWPDSPASSYNVLSSRSHSRASSRAQSPGSGANGGSPFLHLNIVGSPVDSQLNTQNFRGQALSSSESSNHSYGDTPSPSNYQCSLDQRVEEQLGLDFGSFSTWCQSCMSSGTVVNSAETIDAIDNNELQLVEEVIRKDQCEKRSNIEDMQVVPKSERLVEARRGSEGVSLRRMRTNGVASNTQPPSTVQQNYVHSCNNESVFDESLAQPQGNRKAKYVEEGPHSANGNEQHNRHQIYSDVDIPQLGNTGTLISNAQNNLVYPDLNDVYNLTYTDDMPSNVYSQNPLSATDSLMDFENSMEIFFGSHCNEPATVMTNTPCVDAPSGVVPANPTINDFTQINCSNNSAFVNNWRGQVEATKSTFNDFQIPETVTSYRQNRPKRYLDLLTRDANF